MLCPMQTSPLLPNTPEIQQSRSLSRQIPRPNVNALNNARFPSLYSLILTSCVHFQPPWSLQKTRLQDPCPASIKQPPSFPPSFSTIDAGTARIISKRKITARQSLPIRGWFQSVPQTQTQRHRGENPVPWPMGQVDESITEKLFRSVPGSARLSPNNRET